jgi:hypothetical protein
MNAVSCIPQVPLVTVAATLLELASDLRWNNRRLLLTRRGWRA